MHRTHRPDHELVVIQGETFPICRTCGRTPVYEFLSELSHAEDDWDFASATLEKRAEVIEFPRVA